MFNTYLENLISNLKVLGGVGEKTAQRYALEIIKKGPKLQKDLGETLINLNENLKYCPQCYNFSDGGFCQICTNTKRNQFVICIVEQVFDVIVLEKMGIFEGVYHILHGVLSPIDRVKPEDLKIKELLKRIEQKDISEIIFALSPSLEGEATINYIKNLLPKNIKITQIAQGVPSGANLEYTDEITLKRAFQDRH
jgi:recombination protein RecR